MGNLNISWGIKWWWDFRGRGGGCRRGGSQEGLGEVGMWVRNIGGI